MRIVFVLIAALLAGSAFAADPPLAGRWQGTATIPGRELALTIDLDRDAHGAWRGSLICAGLVLSDAPLANIEQHAASIAFEIAGFGAPAAAKPAAFKGEIDKSGRLRGELVFAGNRAPFALSRIGGAQVVEPLGPTPVGDAFAGKWTGEFELGGYPRQVTLTLANGAGGNATAALTVVGKRTTEVAVDLVRQERDRVRIEASTMGIALEAASRDPRTLEGTFELGPLEIPLRLSRTE